MTDMTGVTCLVDLESATWKQNPAEHLLALESEIRATDGSRYLNGIVVSVDGVLCLLRASTSVCSDKAVKTLFASTAVKVLNWPHEDGALAHDMPSTKVLWEHIDYAMEPALRTRLEKSGDFGKTARDASGTLRALSLS
ncbi:MAG: hypothetical protein HGA90_00580 [Alphaproteobacteria bacterium]|nr:hypothetical protein [Alphaproteobacteria bacterium]